ncbi:hypothetical protein [Profundibacter sp.]
MRFLIPVAAALVVSACVPGDTNSGVGFSNYDSYEQQRARREAELRQQAIPAQGAISDETVQTSAATQPPPATTKPQTATRRTTAPTNNSNAGISDEQDFDAVASRETIESDRERLERQRAEYVVIEPTAVPTGGHYSGPNIVKYALSTTNNVGQALYSRSKIFAQARYNRNCQKFPSPDKAQEAFLKSGGPKRDPKGLDPDGDGFACSWDPQPFRTARSGG